MGTAARTTHVGGFMLLAAAAIALAWANSPWKDGYLSPWKTEFTLAVGDTLRTPDLRHVVNEALTALFCFVVGLEVKRELIAGELRTLQKAALSALAALGGMVVPAVVYAAVNFGAPATVAGACRWRPTSPTPSACSPSSAFTWLRCDRVSGGGSRRRPRGARR